MALPSFVKIVNGMPVLDIGACRHQLNFYQQVVASPATYDAAGVTSGWTPFAAGQGVMAALGGQVAGNRKGVDVIKGDQTASETYVTAAMWFVPGITPSMRFKDENGTTYIVQSMEDVLVMQVVLVLTCLVIGAND
jgi:hypothetical protein